VAVQYRSVPVDRRALVRRQGLRSGGIDSDRRQLSEPPVHPGAPRRAIRRAPARDPCPRPAPARRARLGCPLIGLLKTARTTDDI
jgi:hypothetical protein